MARKASLVVRAEIERLDERGYGVFRLLPGTPVWREPLPEALPAAEGGTGAPPERGEPPGTTADSGLQPGTGAAPAPAPEPFAGKPREVAVPFALPGEQVWVRVHRRARRRSALWGEVLGWIAAHPQRTRARCLHFGTCGGCALQHAAYALQLELKRERVRQLLAHRGLVVPVEPVLGMEEPWGYRNKMEFAFRPDGRPGLHARGSFRTVFPLSQCHIAHPDIDRVREEVAAWTAAYGLPGYDKRTHQGLLRHLVVRKAFATGELLAALVATEPPDAYAGALEALAGSLRRTCPGLRGLLWVENRNPADAVMVERLHVVVGEPYIEEELGGFRYRIELETFFQTNPRQAERLLAQALRFARELAGEEPLPLAVDLFSGVGTFTLPLARLARRAVGIEIVAASVEAARANAQRNGVDNALFIQGDAGEGLRRLLRQGGSVPLLLLDPPRSGAGPKALKAIAEAAPRGIVYVSCNPQTFADDAAFLAEKGYALQSVAPVDMFPHTPHVELVACLVRRNPRAAAPAPSGVRPPGKP